MDGIIHSSVQCWGCPVFDRLFQIVSIAAAVAYDKLVLICMVLFAILGGVVIINTVWQNIKGGVNDPFYQQSIKPFVINSLIAFALLGSGLIVPRLISQITFEPTAEIALTYTQAMLKTDNATVNSLVEYQPVQIPDNGFFRPKLRDTIIMLMKTTITQFQSYIKVGFAIMDKALSIEALLGIGAFIQHIILLFVGFYLAYGFFKLFINFCFYFADIIIAMMFFAFFFPLGIVLSVFKGPGVPGWISKMGSGIGAKQVKSLINAIISLASAVLTYTIIMVILAKFFTQTNVSAAELVELITTGNIFEASLADDNLEMMTVSGCVIMLYIINYLQKQIPTITKMVLSAFDVQENTSISQDVANQATSFAKNQFDNLKNIGGKIISGLKSSSGGGTGGGGTP